MKILYHFFFSNRFFILSRLDIVQSVLEVMNICNLHNYSVYSELHVAIEFNKPPKQIGLETVEVTEVIEHRILVAFGLGRRKFC